MSSISHYTEAFQRYLKSLSKDTYIDILENCNIEITVANANGYVIYANPASLQYHGMTSEEMCKLNFFTSSYNKCSSIFISLSKDKMLLFSKRCGLVFHP